METSFAKYPLPTTKSKAQFDFAMKMSCVLNVYAE